MIKEQEQHTVTAGEKGWRLSRYNIAARHPEGNGYIVINLFQGSFAILSAMEAYLLNMAPDLDAELSVLEKFRKFGFIVNFDEKAMIDSLGRSVCGGVKTVSLTLCPTLGCNFDCSYCFETHRPGRMSRKVQDDVITLAEKMMKRVDARELGVTWFGGEPLLAPDIIESLSERLMKLAQERNASYRAGIITNGYLLTEENIALLERCKVDSCQVTIDGLGKTHDATRSLAGGGPTFERIISNLRDNKIPFQVKIRHNTHRDNIEEIEPLRSLILELKEKSGNDISYYPAWVTGSDVADERGRQVDLLKQEELRKVGIMRWMRPLVGAKGHFCGANTLSSVSIDDLGNLYKCWNSVHEPKDSYGNAATWDPEKPLHSAEHPDMLTDFLNTTCPLPDPECENCVWLPLCSGGCPAERLAGKRNCLPFKDDPEAFAQAFYKYSKAVKQG